MSLTLLDCQSLSPAAIRHALGHFATGVTVVTSLTPDGAPVGTTASAVSSLSLAPPLILVCLDRSSQTLAAIRSHGAFAVNVLAEGQEHLSANFARRGGAASWADVGHRIGPTECPRLHDVLAVLDCRLERCVDGGDHEIVIGALAALEHNGENARPLLHYRGSYGALRAA
jgi:3-hydroxy-9,10-secoandrosta-1,3,5(10)-triene-9,17-dione monooxygenase reductase component